MAHVFCNSKTVSSNPSASLPQNSSQTAKRRIKPNWSVLLVSAVGVLVIAALIATQLGIAPQASAASGTVPPTAAASDFAIEDGILTSYSGHGGDVVVPDGVKRIEEYAFSRNASLASVTLPDSVTAIGQRAFEYCSSLTQVLLPNSLLSIDYGAFFQCSSLEQFTIPESVTSISGGAFGYAALSSIDVAPGNPTYTSVEGVLFEETTHTLHTYPYHKAGDTYSVPMGTLSIGFEAFWDCDTLQQMTLPDSLTTLDTEAFVSCDALAQMNVSENVKNIGPDAFIGCPKLKLYGQAGSYAELYAKENGLSFLTSSPPPVEPPAPSPQPKGEPPAASANVLPESAEEGTGAERNEGSLLPYVGFGALLAALLVIYYYWKTWKSRMEKRAKARDDQFLDYTAGALRDDYNEILRKKKALESRAEKFKEMADGILDKKNE